MLLHHFYNFLLSLSCSQSASSYRYDVVVVTVEAASRAACDGTGRRQAVVTGQSGYLAGVWAAETGCGTADAPWKVRLQPGQRINLTLFDFTVPPSTTDNRTSSTVVSDTAAGILQTTSALSKE